MSAVDDVAARIRRLEETRASKIAQLRHLQHELRFNAITGVDERLDNGQSVARLEVKVESGRNMLFKAGFLSGQRTYVRVTVEVVAAAAVNSNDDEQLQSTTVKEHKVTTKRPDQRPMERWHVLKKNDKDLISEILFSCRFQRSPISALELELELLQNQANELHLFIGRHQNLVELPRSSTMSRPKPLQGKEVVPEKTPERTASTRFSAVASFPPNMRKRESEENVSMNVEMHEAPRAKRQRVMDTEKQVNSLSDRIANWLLPAAPLSASTPAAKTEGDSVGMTSTQFFPFKQRQAAPAQRRPRRTGRPLSAAPQQTPSALQAIEKWLFTDKDGNPRELPFGRQAPSY
ncbi:hypothetical protein PC116_g21002 [Phytophthora cactorum]|uniref:Uncharacterized protein n=1 Tax=Phytophthora cactorum TaxID=29920 RepID=A0A8T1K4F6_9STRA|nr:hypothetical protein PC113_g16782 [Phytophthora cactorum]KAG2888301.1 hypothetical protein PC114_g18462 [Phytophthora cactorum]KAG2900054.1 hypothetical protein PC115_g16354 [Phytophthora cactorum]KAG2916015.1 hypothetical protein PC117_g17847 [Phytophthora cactorum]KAG2970867.1 hypothetical protein PC118_g16611 [Phytophthora cactorum]